MHFQKQRTADSYELIAEWIEFFLDCLAELIQQLEQKYERYRKKGAYLNERRKRIVNVVKEAQPVKIRDIHRVLNDISKNTLKKDLKYLVEQNVLEKIGKNKGTIYVINDSQGESRKA